MSSETAIRRDPTKANHREHRFARFASHRVEAQRSPRARTVHPAPPRGGAASPVARRARGAAHRPASHRAGRLCGQPRREGPARRRMRSRPRRACGAAAPSLRPASDALIRSAEHHGRRDDSAPRRCDPASARASRTCGCGVVPGFPRLRRGAQHKSHRGDRARRRPLHPRGAASAAHLGRLHPPLPVARASRRPHRRHGRAQHREGRRRPDRAQPHRDPARSAGPWHRLRRRSARGTCRPCGRGARAADVGPAREHGRGDAVRTDRFRRRPRRQDHPVPAAERLLAGAGVPGQRVSLGSRVDPAAPPSGRRRRTARGRLSPRPLDAAHAGLSRRRIRVDEVADVDRRAQRRVRRARGDLGRRSRGRARPCGTNWALRCR